MVYYESRKRDLKTSPIYECLDERLKTKNEESTRLVDTGLVVELEHLQTKNSLVLVCSLSLHRHSYVPLIFGSRFIEVNRREVCECEG
jgi:hypothetical protein